MKHMPERLPFQALPIHKVSGQFDGGWITPDAGALLLREIAKGTQIITHFSQCFEDLRNPNKIEHRVEELLGQRVYGLALGYEDLNDHDRIRCDPLLATLVGKLDPSGQDRRELRDKGKALAGKSTLNRLELTPENATRANRYQKIKHHPEQIEDFLIRFFLKHRKATKEIILDFDATDDPIHGNQEERFFHGYYGCYCYLPLYVFCGNDLLVAKLRKSKIDGSAGALDELKRIVSQIRSHWRWKKVRIIIRGDSGFCREELMAWCEANSVEFIFGLAQNNRLLQCLNQQMEKARCEYLKTGQPARYYRHFKYSTLKTWSRSRRIIGKAEHLEKGPNPRFVVTSISHKEIQARQLYEDLYCARGEMENRIKEQKCDLCSGRTSTGKFRANQLRLWFTSVAYLILNELRRVGLQNTPWAQLQCGTIRQKVLKIGAWLQISKRKIVCHFSSQCPDASLFKEILLALQRNYAMP